MLNCNPKITRCHLLTVTPEQVARALGWAQSGPIPRRSTSHFCGSEPGACTLGPSEAEELVQTVDYLVRRHRAARASGVERRIVANVEALFFVFFDAIERCLDPDEDCVCSWERRIDDAERLVTFLIDVARVYWSTGAARQWMVKELENLACRSCDVSERDGSFARRSDDDHSAEARAGRLSVLLFDTANDLSCDNWGNEE